MFKETLRENGLTKAEFVAIGAVVLLTIPLVGRCVESGANIAVQRGAEMIRDGVTSLYDRLINQPVPTPRR